MDKLPNEILMEIAGLLPVRDQHTLRCVSRNLSAVVRPAPEYYEKVVLEVSSLETLTLHVFDCLSDLWSSSEFGEVGLVRRTVGCLPAPCTNEWSTPSWNENMRTRYKYGTAIPDPESRILERFVQGVRAVLLNTPIKHLVIKAGRGSKIVTDNMLQAVQHNSIFKLDLIVNITRLDWLRELLQWSPNSLVVVTDTYYEVFNAEFIYEAIASLDSVYLEHRIRSVTRARMQSIAGVCSPLEEVEEDMAMQPQCSAFTTLSSYTAVDRTLKDYPYDEVEFDSLRLRTAILRSSCSRIQLMLALNRLSEPFVAQLMLDLHLNRQTPLNLVLRLERTSSRCLLSCLDGARFNHVQAVPVDAQRTDITFDSHTLQFHTLPNSPEYCILYIDFVPPCL